MTYLCVSCDLLPLDVLKGLCILMTTSVIKYSNFIAKKLIPIQQIGCTAIPSIGINACSVL